MCRCEAWSILSLKFKIFIYSSRISREIGAACFVVSFLYFVIFSWLFRIVEIHLTVVFVERNILLGRVVA